MTKKTETPVVTKLKAAKQKADAQRQRGRERRALSAARRTLVRDMLALFKELGLTKKGRPDKRRGPAYMAPEGSGRRESYERRAQERARIRRERDTPEYREYVRQARLHKWAARTSTRKR